MTPPSTAATVRMPSSSTTVAANDHRRRYAATATAQARLRSASSVGRAGVALQSFADQYGLVIEFPSALTDAYAPVIVFDRLASAFDLVELKLYGSLWIDEWSKYPRDWIAYSQLRAVAFVKDLAVEHDSRAATYDTLSDTMFYDPQQSLVSATYARAVIHHEFSHLIISNNFVGEPFDSAWKTYNPQHFSYGRGGSACRLPGARCLTGDHPKLGFVSGYATSGLHEDEAETYSYLMTASYYRMLKQWVRSDPYLAKKVASCERWMRAHSPEMADGYFDRINR